MPELPELEVIRDVLQRRIAGQSIQNIEVIAPGGAVVIRDLTQSGFEKTLMGKTIQSITRRGKFLIFSFLSTGQPLFMVINPKLTGRLRLSETSEKRHKKTHIIFKFESGQQLRYIDQKQMGQVYLVDNLERIPDYVRLSPEPLIISLDEFRQRLKSSHGEIKELLTRGTVVAGIGNAYADEILWEAGLHPYRKRQELTEEEVDRLYMAMRKTLISSIDHVREAMQDNIDQEPRQFMAVHMKTDLPCPRCGSPISLVSANKRITNFCRTCQPGGLIKGMG
jgi:formamidopyrimidine-DNA glycosylase